MEINDRIKLHATAYSIALAHRVTGCNLYEIQTKALPLGSVVAVKAPRYTGLAVVARHEIFHPDQVFCRLSNGNVWPYPIECCVPVDDSNQALLPRWIQNPLESVV